MCTGGPWQRLCCCLFVVIYHARTYTRTHTISDIVLHPRGHTGNCHVPACNVSFTAHYLWELHNTFGKAELTWDGMLKWLVHNHLTLQSMLETLFWPSSHFCLCSVRAADHLRSFFIISMKAFFNLLMKFVQHLIYINEWGKYLSSLIFISLSNGLY